MEKYISKSAIVAEIEKRLKVHMESNHGFSARYDELKDILSFIDTLDVKEVVDAEIVEVEDDNNSIYAYTHLEICTDEDLSKICKAGDKAKVIIIKQK